MFTRSKMFIHRLRICWLGLAIGFPCCLCRGWFSCRADLRSIPLTLDSGQRTEAAGPFFYDQRKDSEKTWAVPPLLSYDADPATESKEFDLLYPVLTYERYGMEYRWQLAQLLSFSGGQDPDDSAKRFTLFPFYFQQRSPDPDENYTALFPFYGRLQNRLFRDEIFFVLFPIYGESRKRDVVTDNYLYPIFPSAAWRRPARLAILAADRREHKDVTTVTNGFGETEIVGGHDKFFALWPVHFGRTTASAPTIRKNSAPTCRFTAGPLAQRDSTSVLWPFFTWIDDREKKYHEWEGPGRSSSSRAARARPPRAFLAAVQPSHNDTLESDFYLWPLYMYNRRMPRPLDQDAHAHPVLSVFERDGKKHETGAEKKRVDLWPLFTWHRDFNGKQPAANSRAGRTRRAQQPRRRAQLVAALVVVAVGRQSPKPAPPASRCSGILSPRHDAGVEKMLAPVRPFPVSIGFGNEKLRLFYVPVLKCTQRKRPRGEINYV
jgi:hypothetical protein